MQQTFITRFDEEGNAHTTEYTPPSSTPSASAAPVQAQGAGRNPFNLMLGGLALFAAIALITLLAFQNGYLDAPLAWLDQRGIVIIQPVGDPVFGIGEGEAEEPVAPELAPPPLILVEGDYTKTTGQPALKETAPDSEYSKGVTEPAPKESAPTDGPESSNPEGLEVAPPSQAEHNEAAQPVVAQPEPEPAQAVPQPEAAQPEALTKGSEAGAKPAFNPAVDQPTTPEEWAQRAAYYNARPANSGGETGAKVATGPAPRQSNSGPATNNATTPADTTGSVAAPVVPPPSNSGGSFSGGPVTGGASGGGSGGFGGGEAAPSTQPDGTKEATSAPKNSATKGGERAGK